jgi:hypothetical protein
VVHLQNHKGKIKRQIQRQAGEQGKEGCAGRSKGSLAIEKGNQRSEACGETGCLGGRYGFEGEMG